MGKANRRRATAARPRPTPVPFVARPFEGLPGETDWVAMREIIPAATARIELAPGASEHAPTEIIVATVLPMAWPALHRTDGAVLISTQSGNTSGDASRDLAAQLLAALDAEPGTPITSAPAATADTPRLQDLLDLEVPFEVTLHDGFDYWVTEGSELTIQAQESLEAANAAIVPTTVLAAMPSAYFVRVGERAHVRLVLPQDEEQATAALARLHAAGTDGLGEGSRLLGAFRAGGLLIPVWDLDPALDAAAHEEPLAAWATRYAAALAEDAPLTAEERRARSGLLSRQVTLR